MMNSAFEFTDSSNAEKFHDAFCGSLAYCKSHGWMSFNGQRWEVDGDADEAMQGAQLMAQGELEKAESELAAAGSDAAKEQIDYLTKKVKHWKASCDERKVKSMVNLARRSLTISAAKLDADAQAINTPNGIIDLCTGKLIQLKPEELPFRWCTHMTRFGLMKNTADEVPAYNKWWKFVEMATSSDSDAARFLQEFVGSTLYGKVYDESILFATGTGRNGKSTMFNAIGKVLGDYADTLSPDVLTKEFTGDRRVEFASLVGKRYVVAPELDDGKTLSGGVVKQLASTDELKVKALYQMPESINKNFSIVMFMNTLPRVESIDGGTWRRILVLPFNAIIPTNSVITDYAGELVRDCGSVILQWAVDGARMFAEDGFKLPQAEAVKAATDRYRMRENWLAQFIEDCCVRDDNGKIALKQLYAEYAMWCERCGEKPHRKPDFHAAMASSGFRETNTGGNPTFHGLSVDGRKVLADYREAAARDEVYARGKIRKIG